MADKVIVNSLEFKREIDKKFKIKVISPNFDLKYNLRFDQIEKRLEKYINEKQLVLTKEISEILKLNKSILLISSNTNRLELV